MKLKQNIIRILVVGLILGAIFGSAIPAVSAQEKKEEIPDGGVVMKGSLPNCSYVCSAGDGGKCEKVCKK